MKCPYRVSTNKIIVKAGNPKIFEETNFEECYGEDCPLYDDDNNGCMRIYNETGGEL